MAYRGLGSISPGVAGGIREQAYRLLHWWQARGTAVQEIPLRRNVPGILVDVTQTTKTDVGTGIQRTVNNLFRHMCSCTDSILAVRDHRGRLITSYRYMGQPGESREQEVSFLAGDRLLLLDSSWEYTGSFSGILEEAGKKGVRVYAVVYDMFPVQYPELFASPVFVDNFRSWVDMAFRKADAVICISRTTADVVAQYCEKFSPRGRKTPFPLFYIHMGADIPGHVQSARPEMEAFVHGGRTFLMVGTLEPRKGHMVALQALRKLRGEFGQECRLLILGHDGWENDGLRREMEQPDISASVLWVRDAADEELCWAYANADALIAASMDEGFGLPIIEAASFGLPVICSDIPIFREVTQGYANYFRTMDPDALAACLADWLQKPDHPDSRRIHIYSWQESAGEILEILQGKAQPYKVMNCR